VTTIVEELAARLDGLTLSEAAELAKRLRDRWGVEPGAPRAPESVPTTVEVVESTASVFLADPGERRLEVIKFVRALGGLGLKEAKDLVEGAARAPALIRGNLARAEAAALEAELRALGAAVVVVTDVPPLR